MAAVAGYSLPKASDSITIRRGIPARSFARLSFAIVHFVEPPQEAERLVDGYRVFQG